MKKYICQYCNYQTNYPSNIKKHYNTKRHHEKIQNVQKCAEVCTSFEDQKNDENQENKCSYCNSIFKSHSGLNRHLKGCTKKIILEKDSRIQELLKKEEEYLKRIKELEKKCEVHVNENKEITNSVLKIAENQTLIPKKHITNTQYIINNYKDAPNLEFPLVNWSNETMDKYVQLGPVKGLSKIIRDHWVDNIPPEERSIWNIDYSRNKFIIRKDDSWIVDINGVTFQEITIDKIYKHFLEYMKNSERRASELVELMSFMCDIRNKDMGLRALKDAGKYLIYDNEKYQNDPPITF